MNMQKIKSIIANAMQHEANTGSLAGLVRQYAAMRGLNPTEQNIQDTVRFIKEYISQLPEFLQLIKQEAKNHNIQNHVEPLIESALQYLYNPNDLIPDHLGLLGLMDDAYYAIKMIQLISDDYRQKTGRPLISVELARMNQVIRTLIGEPIASQIDAQLTGSFALPMIQNQLQNLLAWGATLPVYNTSYYDMQHNIDVQLGAMGVI
ncbi:MAG: YkvA family protein [Spirochaetia bacterium]